jgi:GH25 family lysozyme M1 (1,4-beta-N-acetylmuramidase)
MDDPLNVVIDISHHNGNVDLQHAAASGILGVIQKATQGSGFVDPTFAINRAKAQAAGLMFGAYHFGTGDDGVAQANHLLATVGDTTHTLLVLDLEANPVGPSMSLGDARAFVTQVNAVTGRYPGLYSGSYIKEQLGSASDPVLAQCWLWLAEYGPTPIVPANWPTWTMWQYTDGAYGPEPHIVPGVGRCDRDMFNGGEDQLQRLWGSTATV